MGPAGRMVSAPRRQRVVAVVVLDPADAPVPVIDVVRSQGREPGPASRWGLPGCLRRWGAGGASPARPAGCRPFAGEFRAGAEGGDVISPGSDLFGSVVVDACRIAVGRRDRRDPDRPIGTRPSRRDRRRHVRVRGARESDGGTRWQPGRSPVSVAAPVRCRVPAAIRGWRRRPAAKGGRASGRVQRRGSSPGRRRRPWQSARISPGVKIRSSSPPTTSIGVDDPASGRGVRNTTMSR